MAETTSVEISIEASQQTGAISAAANQVQGFKEAVDQAGEASKKGSESFGALDEATKSLEKSIGNLVSAAAIGAFFKQAVEESLKEAEALRTLKFAVESTGQSWDRARGQIEAFAAAQQASTRFDDTVTFEVLGKLQRATGDLGQAMSATALAQDISAASGKDLGETTALVNGLITGQERSVKLAQKEFAAYVGTADTTATVLAQLEKNFIGAAAAEDSFTKSLNQSKNFLADFQQRIGDGIVPVMAILGQAVAFVAKGYEELGVVAAGVAAAIFTSFGNLATAIKAVFSGNFGEVRDIWRQTQDELAVIAEETGAAISEIETRYHAESNARVQERVQIRARASEEEVRKEEESAAKKKAAEKKLQDELEALQKKRQQDFKDTLQFISTLSSSSNKQLAAIGKAAAIGNAIINTAEGVTKAFSLGPILGPILAPIVIAAGAAQIATISGVQLQKGGLVDGSPEGIQATIGEAGKKEAVVPLTDARALRDIGQAIATAEGDSGRRGGGDQTIVNINVTAEVPEWQAIMQAIAEEAERGSPEVVRMSRRIVDLAEVNAGRAA